MKHAWETIQGMESGSKSHFKSLVSFVGLGWSKKTHMSRRSSKERLFLFCCHLSTTQPGLHQTLGDIDMGLLAILDMQVQLKKRLKTFIYLSRRVFTIFSKVSSHLRSGLVIPHCRDLLYSFRPKYSFSSQLMSSWFKIQSKTQWGQGTMGLVF